VIVHSHIDAKATTANTERGFAANGDSFSLMGSFPPSNSADQNAQRRSQRHTFCSQARVVYCQRLESNRFAVGLELSAPAGVILTTS